MGNRRKKIGVFFGSRSPEHDISVITAQLVIAGLKALGHSVTPVYLDRRGRWLLGEELGELKIFTDDHQKLERAGFRRYLLDLEASRGQMVFRRKGIFGRRVAVDLAFPALHGSFGEDGTIQGLFEMFQIPYVGCGVTASALTMDKILTKQLFEQAGIPTAKFLFFDRQTWREERSEARQQIEKILRYPLIVKPARLGSSIGVVKVRSFSDLALSADAALHYGERFLVEEAVEDLVDVTIAALGNDQPVFSLLQESIFAAGLLTYQDKYLSGAGTQLGKAGSHIHIPARLDEQTTRQIRDLAGRVFRLFDCAGMARIDFLYDKKNQKIYANEINTMPGTLYHHLWKKSGVDLDELLRRLLELAEERNRQKQDTVYTFESDVLKLASSKKLRFTKDESPNDI